MVIHKSDFRYSAWNHNHGETQMLKLMVDVMILAISADDQLNLTSTTAYCSNFIQALRKCILLMLEVFLKFAFFKKPVLGAMQAGCF